MNCHDAGILIDACADRELDAARSLEVERHLQECQLCSRLYERRRALRSLVRDSAPYFEAPPALENRIRAAVRRAAAPAGGRLAARAVSSPGTSSARWRLLAIAASVAFVSLALWNLAARVAPSAGDTLMRELVASQVRSLMVNHLIDVASSDQHTVKPWFDGKVDFSPPVANFAPQGFALIGGRLDYVEGRPVAVLVYQRRKHFINLFVWPSHRPQSEQTIASRQGFNLVHWTKSGLDFWALSNLGLGELREFTNLARNEGS